MLKSQFITLSLLSLFTFSGCFNSDENTTKEIDTDSTYSISIPEKWEILPKNEYEKHMIFAARDSQYTANIPTTLTISSINSLPPSLDMLIKKNYEQVRENSQDFKIISQEDFEIEEKVKENSQYTPNENQQKPHAKLVTYKEKYSGTNTFTLVYSLNILSYTQNTTYVINILSDVNQTEEEKELIRNILQSFTISL